MNEQTRATATTAVAAVEQRPAAAAPQDAWDRLAALAFGDTASAGGCSVHAHDCTCLAEEHVSVGVTSPEDDAATPGSSGGQGFYLAQDAGDDHDFSASKQTATRTANQADTQVSELAAMQPAPTLAAAERPDYQDPQPDPAPPWTPEPAHDPGTAD